MVSVRCAIVVAFFLGTAAIAEAPGNATAALRRLQAPTPSSTDATPPPPPAPCTSSYANDYNYEACLGWCINNVQNK